MTRGVGVRQCSIMAALVASTACSPSREPAAAPGTTEDRRPPVDVARTDVAGTAPAGAFVRLQPLFPLELPPDPFESFIDQSGQMFTPGAIVLQTGQAVKFRSSEDVLHNVRVIRTEDKATIFNVATPPWGAYTHKFDQAGTYDVTCDIHTAMRATILVAATPYATIADEDGHFSFAGVVPGRYTLIAFSGENEVERPVDIKGSGVEVTVP